MRRPSLTLWLTGFSTYTSLPAWMAQMAARACQWLGVAMLTTSMDLSSSTLRRSWTNLGAFPCAFSTAFMAGPMTPESASQMVVTTQLCLPANPLTWSLPRPLTPMTATCSWSLASPFLAALGSAAAAKLPPAKMAASAVESCKNSRRFKKLMEESLY